MKKNSVRMPYFLTKDPRNAKMVLLCRIMRRSYKTMDELISLTGFSENSIERYMADIFRFGGKIEKIKVHRDKRYRTNKTDSRIQYKVTQFPTEDYKDLGPSEIEQFHPTRKCRKCQGRLELSRYYECLTCKPELPSVDDDFIYEHMESAPSMLPILPTTKSCGEFI